MAEEPVFDMAAARRKFNAAFDNTKTGRKQREVGVAKIVDGRSLRATGRTEQFNFRSRAGLKEETQAAAKRAGMTLAEWMERAADAMLAAERGS
jgi:hypothetical protein